MLNFTETSCELIWAKFKDFYHPTYCGNDTLAISSESIISFINVNSGKESFYRASGDEFGDGVFCIAGHRTAPVFAFAESCIRPKIYVLTFPEFRQFQTLHNEHRGSYVQLRFSEGEYLVALCGMPDFQLEIWNWRSGKLLVAQATGILSHDQRLYCNRATHLIIAQYASDLGKLVVWESHISLDHAFLIKRPADIPFAEKNSKISMTFGNDGNIYMVDKAGNMYSLNPYNNTTKELCKWSGAPGTNDTIICQYKSGFVVSGPHGEVVNLKLVDGVWTEKWTIPPKDQIYDMRVLACGTLFCIRKNATIERLSASETKQEFIQIRDSHRFVKFFEFLRPLCESVVTVSDYNEIRLFDVASGEIISSVEKKHISCMDCHPFYPFIVVGTQNGIMHVLSFYNPSQPVFVSEFHLSAHWIERVSFTPSGDFVVICDRIGDFYVLAAAQTKSDQSLNVFKHFSHENYVFDFCVSETDKMLQILLLSEKDKDRTVELAANIVDSVLINKNDKTLQKIVMDLPQPFTSITSTKTDPSTVLATAYKSHDIHILELKDDTLKSVQTLKTVHQFKYVRIHCDGRYIITCGMDGIVSIFNLKSKAIEAVCFSNSRMSHGTKHVRCDPFRKYFISLGFQGNLYCFKVTPNYEETKKIEEIRKKLEQAPVDLAKGETFYFKTKEEDIGKTWLEIKAQEEYEKECEKYTKEKNNIFKDFLVLREKLKVLIDKNEDLDESERLPLQNFNLNKDWCESLKEMARRERKSEEETLKAYVADQNRITKWIVSNTWDYMEVKGCKVRGILSNIFCENYALLHQNPEDDKNLEKIRYNRIIEKFVADCDAFLPWAIRNQSHLDSLLCQQPRFEDDETGFKMVKSKPSFSESEQGSTAWSKDKFYALTGTSSHKFIDPFPLRYEQLEVVTYQQMMQEDFMGQYDMLNLRMFFNKKFDEVRKIKDEEMRHVKSRNEVRRYNRQELVLLAQLKGIDLNGNSEIIDPHPYPDEDPESIIKVEDWEVPVGPYISPSTQKLMDEQAFEVEQRRLALLADDFRERALIRMMDGVLERRWADEIKKDPSLPKCVIEGKDITEYTTEETQEVERYEAKLKELEMERERYRQQLENEQVKLRQAQNNQIINFNSKCNELCVLKFQVDAAIKQEEIKLLRNRQYNFQRILLKRKENDLMQETIKKKKEIDDITQVVEELEKHVQESRSRYEQLQTKDKLLDKQFKPQFSESAPQLVVDQAYKIFKRRPKWQPKAWATHTILSDMSHRVQAKNCSRDGPPLPEECYEFLSLIESIDNYTHAPSIIDQNLWGLLCKMRRYKIEGEFKLKAYGAQLAEAESTLNAFIKELNAKKNTLAAIEKEKDGLKQQYVDHLMNRTVQLVMPRGIVEVALSGHISDFENCVLLNAQDVEEINSIIKKAGQKKLQTMTNSAVFRRKIIYKEWEHKVLRMTVQDLKDFLNVIENCKVTKEIQTWLKLKKDGRTEDTSQSALNREIQATHKYLNSTLEEINKQIKSVQEKLKLKKRENNVLDKRIQALNVDVTEQNLSRDHTLEEKELRLQKERMQMIVERGKLVRKVQSQHAQILELATLLELQRLRTFPTLTTSQKSVST